MTKAKMFSVGTLALALIAGGGLYAHAQDHGAMTQSGQNMETMRQMMASCHQMMQAPAGQNEAPNTPDDPASKKH